MATAIPHADRTASEARRPEAGSRAGGVSRAERGNDGSPSGARRRRRLDALRARQRDRPSPRWPGTPELQGSMSIRRRGCTTPQASGSGFCRGCGFLADSVVIRGAKPRVAGIARQGFPREASETRSAPEGARRHPAESSGRRLDSATWQAPFHTDRGQRSKPMADSWPTIRAVTQATISSATRHMRSRRSSAPCR